MSAQVMRRVLVDFARSRESRKRGRSQISILELAEIGEALRVRASKRLLVTGTITLLNWLPWDWLWSGACSCSTFPYGRQPRLLDPRRADGDTIESLVPVTARAPSPYGGIATCSAQYM